MGTRKAIGYFRISGTAGALMRSELETQRGRLKAYVEANGLRVVEECVDYENGKRAGRPQFAKALAACKGQEAVLVVPAAGPLAKDPNFFIELHLSGVDFAVLGLEERDSGDVARRLGDEATFQNLAKRNIATLAQYRFKRIVSCDPHSFHVLKNEYGALGGSYEVLHHTTFIDELVKNGALQLGQSKADSVTYHDPCYLGRYNGEYEAPRNVLKAIGIEVKEMQRSGFRSRCCGGGGGAPITDIPGKQRIPDMRMVDIKETGAELVAVGCPQCTAMLEGVVAPRPEIKDIAELVAEVLIESAEAPAKKQAAVKREEVVGVH